MSVGEAAVAYKVFRGQKRPEILEKSAQYNHIKYFELKFRNFLLNQCMYHALLAGIGTYTYHKVMGRKIYAFLNNYLAKRYTRLLMVPTTMLIWYQAITKLNS